MKRAVWLVVLAVVGCASEPSQQEAAAMAQSTNGADLCYYAVAGKGWQRQAATDELQRRHSNCQAEMPLVMARLQNDQARRTAALMFMQQQQQANIATQQTNSALMQGAQRPATAPSPQQTTVCSSQVVGGQLQTICQ